MKSPFVQPEKSRVANVTIAKSRVLAALVLKILSVACTGLGPCESSTSFPRPNRQLKTLIPLVRKRTEVLQNILWRFAGAHKTIRALNPEPISSDHHLDCRYRILVTHRSESERVAHGFRRKYQKEHGLFRGHRVHCLGRNDLNRSLDWFLPVFSC
jgi:hypothetical protein